MTCPSCKLENPPSALYCDCGYEFVEGSLGVVLRGGSTLGIIPLVPGMFLWIPLARLGPWALVLSNPVAYALLAYLLIRSLRYYAATSKKPK
jgi:hypothetical protein